MIYLLKFLMSALILFIGIGLFIVFPLIDMEWRRFYVLWSDINESFNTYIYAKDQNQPR